MDAFFTKELNTTQLGEILDTGELIFSTLKATDPSKVPLEIKSKVFNNFQKSGFLLTLWDARNTQKSTENKSDNSISLDDDILKYLFEGCLERNAGETYNVNCKVCKMVVYDDCVNDHLKSDTHMLYYEQATLVQRNRLWKQLSLQTLANKQFIMEMSNNTLYCKLCGVTFVSERNVLFAHLTNDIHRKNFKQLTEFKFACKNGSMYTLKTKLQFGNDVSCSSDSNNETAKSNSVCLDLTEVATHAEYMSKRHGLHKMSFFCQPCKYYKISVEGDFPAVHENSPEHNQSFQPGIEYEINTCKNCDDFIMCTTDFYQYHIASCINHKPDITSAPEKCIVNTSQSIPSLLAMVVEKPAIDIKLKKSEDAVDLAKVLNEHMKDLLKYLLINARIITGSNRYYGFFCAPCNFWTRENKNWFLHNSNEDHKLYMETEPKNQMFRCTCYLIIISDEELFNAHECSPLHKNLKEFISQKIANAKELAKSVDTLSISGSSRLGSCTSLNSSIQESGSSSDSDNMAFLDNVSMFSKTPSSRTSLPSTENKKHKTKNTKKITKPKRNCETGSWFGVKGLHNGVQNNDIEGGFSKLGKVIKIERLDVCSANVLLTLKEELKSYSNDIINGYSIHIKGSEYPVEEKINVQFQIPESLKNKMADGHLLLSSLHQQYTNVDASGFGTLKAVEDDIKTILPEALAVISIGSRSNRVAVNDSENDIFVQIEEEGSYSSREKHTENRNNICKAFKLSPLFNQISVDGLQITGVHLATGLKCRVSCGSSLVIEKNDLIRSYVNVDPRVQDLVVCVKFWAKQTGISDIISGYALTWMVLFFLMQPEVGFLQPVHFLKATIKSFGHLHYVKGWECGITRLRQKVRSIDRYVKCGEPTHSAVNLLKQFFRFYGNEPFFNVVLCPLIGAKVNAHQIRDLKLPTEFSTYIRTCYNPKKRMYLNKSLNLQDPVQLNKNLTGRLEGYQFVRFKTLCKLTFDILK